LRRQPKKPSALANSRTAVLTKRDRAIHISSHCGKSATFPKTTWALGRFIASQANHDINSAMFFETSAGAARMKKLILATSVAFAAMTASTQAADLEMDRELGLIVPGVVDSWAGVQIIDAGGFGDDTVWATGGDGRLAVMGGSARSC
jgi:hypothetical protein